MKMKKIKINFRNSSPQILTTSQKSMTPKFELHEVQRQIMSFFFLSQPLNGHDFHDSLKILGFWIVTNMHAK